MQLMTPLLLAPDYRDYVWGGERLRPGQRTAEMWVVYEGNRVAGGTLDGRTLAEVAEENPAGLLGERVFERTGRRFPLLVKILDPAQWMSVQVHPDDRLAEELEGPGHFGKTEAWHFIDAEPGAEVIAGVRPGISQAALATAIRDGKIMEVLQRHPARKGDTVFMPARTIHALGPGLLIYEVQQTSDITYRVYDWDRPATPQRPLHIEKSLQAADASLQGQVTPAPRLGDGERAVLAASPYFVLEMLAERGTPVQLSTEEMTFHTLTVTEGAVELIMPTAQPSPDDATEIVRLGRYQSAVVPAACGPYELRPLESATVLKASVEE